MLYTGYNINTNRYNMTTIQSMSSFTVIITIALLYIVVGNDVNAATIINNNQHHRRHTRWYELSNNYTFDKYVVEYEKVYIDTEEFVQREKNFNKNLKYIMEHNEIPNVSYHMGVNIFTDWSQEEFYERRLRRGKKDIIMVLEIILLMHTQTLALVVLVNIQILVMPQTPLIGEQRKTY